MIKNIFDIIKTRKTPVDLTGINGSERAYLTARIFSALNCPVIAVLPTKKDALRFMDDLAFFLPEQSSSVFYFPGYNILPFSSLAYHGKTSAKRISTLYRMICQREKYILVTHIDTLLQKMIPKQKLSGFAEIVINNDEIDRDNLISRLNSGGYEKTSLVEEQGDYSVRGGILDIFSPGASHPVRIELFGDYVESLRYFSPATQRGTREISETVILPASEAIFEKAFIPHILTRLRRAGAKAEVNSAKLKEYADTLREEGKVPGLESMLSIVYPELDSFFNYIPENALILLDRPGELKAEAEEFEKKAILNYENAKSENKLCVSPVSIYLNWKDAESLINAKKPVSFRPLNIIGQEIKEKKNGSGNGTVNKSKTGSKVNKTGKENNTGKGNKSCKVNNAGKVVRKVIELNSFFEDNSFLSAKLKNEAEKFKNEVYGEHLLKPLADFFIEKEKSGMSTVAVCSSDVQARRLISLLQPYGIEPLYIENFRKVTKKTSGIFYTIGSITNGFSMAAELFAIISDQEIFGSKRQRIRSTRKKSGTGRAKTKFITPEELKKGDIVVHLEHGLGRYEGLSTIKVMGISGDFILISYRNDDKLYLPVDRMEMIEKYIGMEGYNPLLDKMGGKTWLKSRAKAKKEVEKIAGDLLNLYAKRRVNKGFAFSPPNALFNDFEAGFPYEETPDQLKAIDDVLNDMEDETPMDRLVCGDVGYGKTEVSIRAAFKAVNDGKQVAVVVPTTILAEQHLKTFRQRFDSYPVRVEALSRFRTKNEQKTILKGLEDGTIDIVIGTHRLIQKDIVFKALGLLVIDEEQRFGVKHKESLKKARSTVDVLALTATPIPRTLHMSLTGMRDISVISTPPENRQAIVSYISGFDDSVAAEAIKKEIARKGQIFFIHNNIKTIFKTAENLQKLVPEVRIGVAHGRLSESNLEKVMVQFINRDIDMLVCTTIVESGLDIPSANTMIINRADKFGLAQIYQLRGRIGRGMDQAYAYLFVPDEHKLTRNAKKRLAALMEHRDLGSGFQIAMKDLQIRGAGSALGVSQSGHIAAVGYDMFLKLLDEAMADLKGQVITDPLEPEINIAVSAYISDEYVQSIEQRLTIYRRLSQMTAIKEISDMQKELIDRFGKLPEEAGNMLLKIMLRVLAIRAGVKRLDLVNNSLSMIFSKIHQKQPFTTISHNLSFSERCKFTSDNSVKISLGSKRKNISPAIAAAKKILKEIADNVN